MRMCGELWVLLQDIAVRVAVRCCSMSQFRITSRPFSESCKHMCVRDPPRPFSPAGGSILGFLGLGLPLRVEASFECVLQCVLQSMLQCGVAVYFVELQWRWVLDAVAVCVACVAVYVARCCCCMFHCVAVKVVLGCCCSVCCSVVLQCCVAVCFIVLQWRRVCSLCYSVCVLQSVAAVCFVLPQRRWVLSIDAVCMAVCVATCVAACVAVWCCSMRRCVAVEVSLESCCRAWCSVYCRMVLQYLSSRCSTYGVATSSRLL